MELVLKKVKMNKLNKAFSLKVDWIREECSNGAFDALDTENFYETDLRSAKAFAEMCRPKEEIAENCRNMLKSFAVDGEEGEDTNMGMITQGPIYSNSLCPHHLLPVMFEVYVSYLPRKGAGAKVLGLSKLTRLTKEICKYPTLQETYAKNLADVLYQGNKWLEGVQSEGSAVIVIGQHGCMACRGCKSNSLTVSTEIRGCYKDNDLEQKFYKQVEAIRSSSLRRLF